MSESSQAQPGPKPTTSQVPPLNEGSPVTQASLVENVNALGESTGLLVRAVEKQTQQRRGITVAIALVLLLVVAQAIYGFIALDKISNTDRLANSLTSVQAQRDQIARADYRTDRTIFCINSFASSMQKGTTYDARCPQAYPGVPIVKTPGTP